MIWGLESLSGSLDDATNKITFAKRGFVVMLFAYSIGCFVICVFFSSDLRFCLFSGFLIALVTLYLVTLIRILDKLNKEQIRSLEQENELQKDLKHEYQEIHKKQIKNKLLEGAKSTDPYKHETKSFGHKVHVDYLNKFKDRGTHRKLISGDAESSLLG